ncbi:cation:proton antiporter [Spongiibacter sp. KMU-158]|uniref:Cation:proton antiporter n=1 Tax=Spongiibacter pelagi TaxID=2760804 RepID=A0A927C4C2_9GAMM|nr:cation:proton antiporter [Spongiibacter pelagi]MBD2859928.1 cation:proton antiporter [Spongiibacter pelagi]
MLIGALLALGLLGESVGRKTQLPRVTILILLGVVVGPVGFDVLPALGNAWFDYVATIALTLIGFLLGAKLDGETLAQYGLKSLWLALGITLVTFGVVVAGLGLLGVALPIALVLGGVSLATDPLATTDVIEESGKDTHLTRLLTAIVALDDVWGLMLFGLLLSGLSLVINGNYEPHFILEGMREMLGGIALGAALGIPMAFLSGRIQEGEPTLVEALAMVFLCSGLALYLDVSYLLAAITMGMVVGRLAKHHDIAFHEIRHIEWPVLIVFLILVGVSFKPEHLYDTWPLVLMYLVFRTLGRVLGGYFFARGFNFSARQRAELGFCLLPQAGVALAAALYAGQEFPQLSEVIFSVTVMATVLFEIIGPMATRWVLANK